VAEVRRTPAHRRRVVYVDDVEDTRVMVSTMLREYGAEVESASSASDALLTLHRIRLHDIVRSFRRDFAAFDA
jgi:CheY-like chemotaxis protein